MLMAQNNDAPPPAENGGAAPPPPKASRLKPVVLMALPLLIGLAGGLIGAKLMLNSKTAEAPLAALESEGAPPPGGLNEAPPIELPRKEEHGPAPSKPPAAAGGEHRPKSGGDEAARPEGPYLVDLKPFVVNLSEPSGKRYLKVTMSLDVESPALASEVEARLPAIRDMILLLLSSQSLEDIRNQEGKTRLRGQIMNRINGMLSGGRIRNIYFSEFVVT